MIERKRFGCILTLTFFLNLVTSCSNDSETTKIYYKDGRLRSTIVKKNGVRDGMSFEYHPNGKIKLKGNWKDGQRDGEYEEYDENGLLTTRIIFKNNIPQTMSLYHQNGVVSEVREFDENGFISSANMYNERGVKDTTAYPFFYFNSNSDTIRINKKNTLHARIMNTTRDLYKNGTLVISSGYDSIRGGIRLDTLKLIESKDQIDYSYDFIPSRLGMNFICGQFIFQEETKDKLIISNLEFTYPYFVVE